MRTKTFARLSLLIPLVVWVLSLSVAILASTFFPDQLNEPTSLMGWAGVLILFYAIGIIIWFIPYLLIAIGLLILTFISQVRVLKIVFALSPVAMAVVLLIAAALIAYPTTVTASMSSDLAGISYQETLAAIGLFGVVTLLWGYICVGIGFGLYKTLQILGIIKDDFISGPEQMTQIP